MTQFVFGFAGIPQEIYEDVERDNKRYAEGAEIELFALRRCPTSSATPSVTSTCHHALQRHGTKENGNSPRRIAIMYIEPTNIALPMSRTPSSRTCCLCRCSGHWTFQAALRNAWTSKNQLIPLLAQATLTARASLRGLRHEVVSNANSTPFLLPVLNFSSKALVPVLSDLHTDLATGRVAPLEAISQRAAEFRREHQFKYDDEADEYCYTDNERIHFKPPGSNRHGYARAGGEHALRCLLSGRRRLGAPYDKLFHYDCVKGPRGNLKARFHGCHEPKREWKEAQTSTSRQMTT